MKATFLVLTLCASSTVLHGDNLLVSGIAHGELYPTGRPEVHLWCDFQVAVNECQWLIKVQTRTRSDAAPESVLLNYESWSDATNVYTAGYLKPDDRTRIVNELPTPSRSRAAVGLAFIEKAVVPRGDSNPLIGAIWYAYCSRCYLQTLKKSEMEPPFSVNDDLYFYQRGITNLPVLWQPLDQEPYLPSWIVFLHQGKVLNRDSKEVRLPAPFNKGFTNAVFRVISIRSSGGRVYPQHTTLEIQYPLPDDRKKSLSLRRIQFYDFEITNSTVLPSAFNFVPELSATVNVIDRRFMKPDRPRMDLSYTTNRWLTDAEVQALPVYRSREQLSRNITRSEPRHPRLMATAIYVTFGTFLFLPFFFMICRRHKSKTTQNERLKL